MRADKILELLATKHSDDIFVPECKDGPSGPDYARLDAWAMPRSWAHMATVGYEIKVSRSDFLNDNKWQKYLDLCNLFYFVCCPGVVKPEEIPEQCGYMVTSKTGSRLFTKKKAPYREIEQPLELYQYILMSRVKIRGPRWQAGGDLEANMSNAECARRWLAEKEENRDLGHKIGHTLRDMFDRQVREVRRDNEKLQIEIESLKQVKLWSEMNGIDLGKWDILRSQKLGDILEGKEKGCPKRLIYALQIARDRLENAIALVKPGDDHK